jgi:ribosome-associated protein
MTRLTDSILFDDHEVQERFVRATGPGGRNPDKEATAVELRVDLRTSSLPPDLKTRLIALAGRNVTDEGVLVVVSRAHRSQAKNRDAARARLLALMTRAAHPAEVRVSTIPPSTAREERLRAKHRTAAVKRSRSEQDAESR